MPTTIGFRVSPNNEKQMFIEEHIKKHAASINKSSTQYMTDLIYNDIIKAQTGDVPKTEKEHTSVNVTPPVILTQEPVRKEVPVQPYSLPPVQPVEITPATEPVGENYGQKAVKGLLSSFG